MYLGFHASYIFCRIEFLFPLWYCIWKLEGIALKNDHRRDNILAKYFNSRLKAHYSDHASWLRIIAFVFVYFFIAFFQIRAKNSGLSGIIAQVLVIMSIYLVIQVVKLGYIVSVAVNLTYALFVTYHVVFNHETQAIPGIILPISTIVIVSIISFYGRRLNHQIKQVKMQRQEIQTLYETVAEAKNELVVRNNQLLEYNQILEENESRMQHLSNFDLLTELPNRATILGRLDLLINIMADKKLSFSFIFIDIDNFGSINEDVGHRIGDMLLQSFSLRLGMLIHTEDMIGRLGSDEYALVIQRQMSEQELFSYIESIRVSLQDVFPIEGNEYSLTASFGVSIFPSDGVDAEELLQCANVAMLKAKENGKNCVQFFRRDMRLEIEQKIIYQKRLINSIKNNELFLVYQPQFTPDKKRLRGLEALVRWNSAKFGVVSPVQFIPIAEEAGYIIPMGEWILRSACKKAVEIEERYHKGIIISVNISSVQLMAPNFISMVSSVLKETNCEGRLLEFEVTESVMISSLDIAVSLLKEIKTMGIRVALDDFGTGYSSFRYIQLLPIDTLKIDKSFIDSIEYQDTQSLLVAAIITLVHQLNLEVVAEGVDSEKKVVFLTKASCDYLQGHLWGMPAGDEDTDMRLAAIFSPRDEES